MAKHVYLLKVTPRNNVNTFSPNGRTRVRKFKWTGGDSVRFTAPGKFLIRLEIVKAVRRRQTGRRGKVSQRSLFKTVRDNESPLNKAVIADSNTRQVKPARRQAEFLCRCSLIDKKTHLVHGWEKTQEDGLSGDPVVHK